MIKKTKRIYFLKIIAVLGLLFICLFLFETKTSKAALGTAACNAKGGSCDLTCISSDYESLGTCDYGQICCRKKLVGNLSADPDPAGKGNFAAGTCGSSGEGTCKFFVAIGGTICGDDKNIGQDTCSYGYNCCVPKTNIGVGSTNPTTANPTAGSSAAATGASNIRTGSTGGLVPCTDDCTLCHLVLGFKNIYDYLLTLLLAATTLVVVVAGVIYMVSSGDKGMIDKAKSALTYALTAMILGLTAWLIINATLSALGYKHPFGGSWYNFTCDTVQTQGPTGGTGVGTLPGTGTGTGTGSYTPNGNLNPTVQKVLKNYMTMNGMTYGGEFSGDTYGGKSTADCGSTSIRAWLMDGLPDFWGLPRERWDGDLNSLKPGDICIFDKSVKDHAFLVMENGATSAASSKKGIWVDPDGLAYNTNLVKGNSQLLYVVHIANYLK